MTRGGRLTAGLVVAVIAVSAGAAVAISWGGQDAPVQAAVTSAPLVGAPSPKPAPTPTPAPSVLSADQAAALAYLREEEKLARDVYLVLAGTSGDRRFTMITRSEQQHYDAVGVLLTTYGVDDPAAGRTAGTFTDPTLQDAYDQFVRDGTQSRAAALEVGRTIERMDIKDIADRRADLPQADIRATLDRLAVGSERHLAAFSR